MATILDTHLPFRDNLMPASFRGVRFHAEVVARENGRRVVQHQFPKKELPYAEDMGRAAKSFTVRAYYATFPLDDPNADPRYRRDYRVGRDLLIGALESTAGPATLQLGTFKPETVVVTKYRVTEEDKLGGYVVFDIEFAEFGLPPDVIVGGVQNTAQDVTQKAMTTLQLQQNGLLPWTLEQPGTPPTNSQGLTLSGNPNIPGGF